MLTARRHPLDGCHRAANAQLAYCGHAPTVSVSISGRQLHDRSLVDDVRTRSLQPRKEQDITRLVEAMRAKATTDPGYLDLDVWYEGPCQKALGAWDAAKARKARRKPKGLRTQADIERRPVTVRTHLPLPTPPARRKCVAHPVTVLCAVAGGLAS